MTFVDALVVVLLLAAAWSGFRRGFIRSTIALIGAVGGAVAGIRFAPVAMSRVGDGAAKVAIGMAFVVVGVGIGELAGSTVGRALAERVTWRPAKVVDHGLGLVGHTAAVLVITWMVAVPLGSVPYPWLSSSVRASGVLRTVDKVMPSGVRDISDRMRQLFDDSGFPVILDPLTPTPAVVVGAPDNALTNSPALRQAARSVLKVRGVSNSCSRRIEGSGFVIGVGRLATNAHVVAGTSKLTVEDGTRQLPARVVVYDPQRDLAVLDVPGLNRPALRISTRAGKTGDSAAAVGYPLDGALTVTPGRVRSEISLIGPDIYRTSTVTRDVYAVRAVIQAGNSGGPLLATDGSVVGVIFGKSIDRPDTAFALTAAEAAPVLAGSRTRSSPVDTGVCVDD